MLKVGGLGRADQKTREGEADAPEARVHGEKCPDGSDRVDEAFQDEAIELLTGPGRQFVQQRIDPALVASHRVGPDVEMLQIGQQPDESPERSGLLTRC